jgi:pSer/pThr/pTyr-binding forkhead associated (FHA) protein
MPEIIVKLGDNIVHKYIFDKEIMSVGRARDNDIVIENLSVSRNHARIRKESERFILTDLNSANGTFVNGVRVTRVEIVNDDAITIGKHKLHFIDMAPSDEEIIGEAFGAERTMLVDHAQTGRLVVSKGKQKDQDFKVSKYETYIGRASDNDVRLHDWFVSKKHAVVIRQGANFFIKDLGSWRGTMVNGKNVRDCELKEGDEIQLGTTVLTFKLEGEGAVPQITGRVPQELAYDESEAGLAAAAAFQADDRREETPADQAVEAAEGEFEAEVAAEAVDADDEFAPLSEEELMELEAEEREIVEPEDGLAAVAASDFEDEPNTGGLAAGEADFEEEQFAASARPDEEEVSVAVPGLESSEEDEQKEEKVLLGEEAGGESGQAAEEAAEASYQPVPEYQELPQRESDSPAATSQEPDNPEIAMWMNGLKNRSRVIRREAARKLKQLTGRDYDWESAPE